MYENCPCSWSIVMSVNTVNNSSKTKMARYYEQAKKIKKRNKRQIYYWSLSKEEKEKKREYWGNSFYNFFWS